MLSLWKIIEKSLLLRKSASFTSFSNLNVSNKTFPLIDVLLKTTIRCYFNPNLDKAYSKDKIVLVGKNIYYKNIVLFVQLFQSLVIFKRAIFMKVNIATSLLSSAFKWYIFERNNFDCNILNNNPDIKSWINIFFYFFKVPTSIFFDLLTHKTYPLGNTHA